MRSNKKKTSPRVSTLENGNLVLLIISYLNLKDFSILLQVNKYFFKLSNHLQNKWRDGCMNNFSFILDSPSVSLITPTDWKKLLKKNITIRKLWNNILSNEILEMKTVIYKELKDVYPFPRLRKQNKYFESFANSELQIYLMDMLYEEQNLYNELDNYFKKGSNNFSIENQKHFPFEKLIDNIQSYVQIIKQNNILKQILIELRWYIFNNNHFNISKQTLPIHILRILSLTLMGYCAIIINYINDMSRPEDIINEYNIRYKNYCQMAIVINEKYQNLSICINYIYDSIHITKIAQPKFSIIRLCMRIWNSYCLKKVKNNLIESLRISGDELIKINLRELINDSGKSLNSSLTESTNYTSQYSININKIMNKFNISFYEIFSMLNDTLCDEFIVYKINHSNFKDSNELVSLIENNYITSLITQINNIFLSFYDKSKDISKINYPALYSFIKNFIFHLKNYSYLKFSKIIPRFRIKIFECIYNILKNQLNNIIVQIFLNVKDNINEYKTNINYENFEIFEILCELCNNDYDKVSNFLNWYHEQKYSLMDLLNICMKWYIEEQGKIISKNKQIENEIKKQNLTFIDEISEKNKILTSFSTMLTIEDIKKIDQDF